MALRRLRSGVFAALALTLANCTMDEGAPGVMPGAACAGVQLRGSIFNHREAVCFMLGLVNHERTSRGLPPVTHDETAARAGQLHTNSSATHGFSGHWDLEGRKPDQRYTEAGGRDVVRENVHFAWLHRRSCPLVANPRFTRDELRAIHDAWMESDAHRANILAPLHTHLGVGLSRASPTCEGAVTAAAQEFVDRYGRFADVPLQVRGEQELELTGELDAGVSFVQLDVAHEPLPEPATPGDLQGRGGYSVPDADVRLMAIDADVDETGRRFLVRPSVGYAGPGVYYLRVWAQVDALQDVAVVSQRTVVVDP